mgnify:CR=1 FL=1
MFFLEKFLVLTSGVTGTISSSVSIGFGADFIRPLSFSDDGSELFFASSSQQQTPDEMDVYTLRLDYKNQEKKSDMPIAMHPKKLNLGPATAFEVNVDGTLALFGRNTQATRPWRKYGGGASGDVWIAKNSCPNPQGKDGKTFESVMMIPATPNSQLKKMIQERLRALKLGNNIKIIEKSGQKFIEVLKQHNKQPNNKQCSDPNCLVAKTKGGGNCKKNDVVYVIKCKECENKYTGETSRNAHTRSIEHMNDAASNSSEEQEKSVLLRHMNEKHDGKKVDFEMRVLKAYQHDPLGRQCAEAVWIKNVNPSERINNKNEFHQPGDVEVLYEKNENENQKQKKKRIIQENNMQNKIITQEYTQNTITKSVGVPKHTEPTIIDFITRIREKASDKNKDATEDENVFSSQDMINDARARRYQKGKTYKCDHCDFKSTSQTLSKRHQQSVHKEVLHACDQCDHKATAKGSLDEHTETQHKNNKIQCNECDYKAATTTNLEKHKESIHFKYTDPEKSIQENINVAPKKLKYVSKRIQCENCEKNSIKRKPLIHI